MDNYWRRLSRMQWQIQRRGPPLFLDQTEGRKKIFFETAPLSLSEGLDPTSFPGLFPLKLGGAGLFPPLPISMGKALGTRLVWILPATGTWRIMPIEEDVIQRGWRPRWITMQQYQNNWAKATSSPGLLRPCRPFFLLMACTTDVILLDIAIVFQIWSPLTGNEGLAGRFEPIRNEEMFWMNNNLFHGLCRNAN